MALTEITRDELKRKLDGGEDFVLVDALAPMSFAHSHLPRAVNLPPEWVDERGPGKLPQLDAEIVVYCADVKCDSSTQVIERLLELGYRNVAHYPGGKRDWIEAGFPVEGGGVSRRIRT